MLHEAAYWSLLRRSRCTNTAAHPNMRGVRPERRRCAFGGPNTYMPITLGRALLHPERLHWAACTQHLRVHPHRPQKKAIRKQRLNGDTPLMLMQQFVSFSFNQLVGRKKQTKKQPESVYPAQFTICSGDNCIESEGNFFSYDRIIWMWCIVFPDYNCTD